MAEYICSVCGNEVTGSKLKRGSGKAEFWIWFAVTPLGPFYSIWRRVGVKRECADCKLPTLVKLNSEQGMQARRRFDIELGLVKPGAMEEKKSVRISNAPTASAPIESFGNAHNATLRETKKPVKPEEW